METALTQFLGEPPDAMGMLDVQETTITMGATNTILCTADTDRVYLSFGVAAPGGGVWVSLRPMVATNSGSPLNSAGEEFRLNYREHLSLVQQTWNAFTAIAGTLVIVREVFYRRRKAKLSSVIPRFSVLAEYDRLAKPLEETIVRPSADWLRKASRQLISSGNHSRLVSEYKRRLRQHRKEGE